MPKWSGPSKRARAAGTVGDVLPHPDGGAPDRGTGSWFWVWRPLARVASEFGIYSSHRDRFEFGDDLFAGVVAQALGARARVRIAGRRTAVTDDQIPSIPSSAPELRNGISPSTPSGPPVFLSRR